MNAYVPANAAVWFEIPVTDLDRSRAFYGAVLQNELALKDYGVNLAGMFACEGEESVAGHLYPGKPAQRGTGSTIHLAVRAPLEAAIERVSGNGGQMVSGVNEIPAGRFAYCLDPDGNSFGLFEA